jgi:hypothetical protein
MSNRNVLFVLVAVVAIFVVLLKSCAGTPLDAPADGTAPSQAMRADDAADREKVAVRTRELAIARQREEAMYAAVSTLHRYLAALGDVDRAKADGFWTGRGPPAASGEADLRSLENLRSFRTENGTPKPLDSSPVPNALEIPVELRASLKGVPMRRYRGWYRMRRAVSDDGWEITSASIQAVAR